jgi:hypothetical protein
MYWLALPTNMLIAITSFDNINPFCNLLRLPFAIFRLEIGASTMPEVEEDPELRTFKRTKLKNVKAHWFRGD